MVYTQVKSLVFIEEVLGGGMDSQEDKKPDVADELILSDLERLPDEVLLKILYILKLEDQKSISQASKKLLGMTLSPNTDLGKKISEALLNRKLLFKILHDSKFVKHLLKIGADFNAITFEDTQDTPLHTAASYANNHEVVRLLLDHGANINAVNCDGSTPLHSAAQAALGSTVKTIQLLCERGANVDVADKEGNTPLHLAVQSAPKENVEKIIELLLSHKANINAVNKKLETPLHLAVGRANGKIATLLLERGADINAEDEARRKPIQIAWGYGFTGHIVKLLKEAEEKQNPGYGGGYGRGK